ncbi:trypsin-like peptidase domain-containing protein [Gilvibacter sp.]|uniref:trypsin-like peptidase domain-containing protein n=1 Tax=Gilvibacter sp. TaxID=2729997 RepID=UPI0025C2F358|nr:trypsin-like peptidase domain-containing protein [Gilvibacter sp.]NQX76186.1 trypsin-like peptidase domain-containing protein [Gilvibacter sp.]
MKKNLTLFAVALLAGMVTLGGYKLLEDKTPVVITQSQQEIPVVNTGFTNLDNTALAFDFTTAAETSVNAVVHVKNTTISKGPTSIMDFFYGGGGEREMVGTGSGVIISPDGYIVTNNHVIENASELEVTLNDNQMFAAELIGTDPSTDIALIKIESDTNLPYLAFGDSNEVKVGEWVLAVGNPFNLTSTVTAGIVSAKSRDLNQYGSSTQSFIQTDAAVNRGNSGGALVNVRGELIGINTAITSQTGSYVGYSFAVPSNNTKKVIEDILEFGFVQRGILGIRGVNVADAAKRLPDVSETEGVYVSTVEIGSGADLSGIQQGDIIKQIDGISINKFTDLVGYVGSKRPNDIVDVTIIRDGDTKTLPVTLVKLETYQIDDLGIEVKNVSEKKLKEFNTNYGVSVNRVLTRDMGKFNWDDVIITKINDERVENIEDVRRIIENRDSREPFSLTMIDRDGEVNKFIVR